MNWHFPRLRRLYPIIGGVVGVIISLTPASAVENVRAFVEFVGLQPASWLRADTLSSFARPWALGLSFAVLAWGLWPERRSESVAPRPNWLKLSDAPFELAPRAEYARYTSLWLPLILNHSLPGGREPVGIKIKPRLSQEDAATIRGTPLSDPAIVWETRRFKLAWHDDSWHSMTSFHPWDVRTHDRPKQVSKETWDAICDQSEVAWSLLTRGLADLIAAGKVRVWARNRSATAPFTRLNPDAWAHYKVADWPAGRAVGEGDDRLFSIYIELPRRLSPFPHPPAIAAALKRAEAQERIKRLKARMARLVRRHAPG